MAQRRKPSRPPAKGPKAKRPQQARRSQQPFRRRRSRYTADSQRKGVLLVIVVVFVGIAGIALANSFSNSGSSVSDTAASQEPTPSPAATTASPTPTATQPTAAPKTASPTPGKTPRERHTVAPVTTPKSTPKPTATATTSCPPAATRMASARATLRHPSALPQATVVTAGPRSGTLATADPPSRTITLYLRSCAEEPTQRLAVVWMYEAGQLLDVRSWDSSTQNRWQQLRGATFGSTLDLQRDVAAVFAYWQTGSTEAWQSPVAPPSPSRLNQLAPYLQ